MIKIGEKQELFYIRMAAPGAYLAQSPSEKEGKNMVLLPGAQVPERLSEGDIIEVFVYLDSKDRPVATVKEPYITLEKTAILKVLEVTSIGAFLDWGLEKDLLLPFAQQTKRVKKGDEVLCGLYIDKSGRLCATMDVYKYLKTDLEGRFMPEDWTYGIVYGRNPKYGVFVAVADEYAGLIPTQEAVSDLDIGDKVKVRIARIRDDGRLDLSLRDKAYMSINKDVKILKAYKEAHGGDFPFNDKSSPEEIRQVFNMSKAQFKRAYGHIKYEE